MKKEILCIELIYKFMFSRFSMHICNFEKYKTFLHFHIDDEETYKIHFVIQYNHSAIPLKSKNAINSGRFFCKTTL